MEILEEERTRSSYSLGSVGIEDWSAVGGSVDGSVRELWVTHCIEAARN